MDWKDAINRLIHEICKRQPGVDRGARTVLQKLKPFYVMLAVIFAIDRLIHEIREKWWCRNFLLSEPVLIRGKWTEILLFFKMLFRTQFWIRGKELKYSVK